MSKAVLVMDMPESCYSCRYCNEKQTKHPCCALTNHSGEYQSMTLEDIYSKRQGWCPLRPLPEKKEPTKIPISPILPWDHTDYEKGWNECIDEMTGGKNGK